jgi:hypothetical protein
MLDKTILNADSHQFQSNSHFGNLKSMTNSCSQTAEGVESMIDEGGTTVNDLLLSSSSRYNQDMLLERSTWSLPPNMRDALASNKNPLMTNSIFSRMLDSNLAGVSTDPTQHLYCHRSIGTQTLPDTEYPSHIYYSNPDFASHIVEPCSIQYITPEELPARSM